MSACWQPIDVLLCAWVCCDSTSSELPQVIPTEIGKMVSMNNGGGLGLALVPMAAQKLGPQETSRPILWYGFFKNVTSD